MTRTAFSAGRFSFMLHLLSLRCALLAFACVACADALLAATYQVGPARPYHSVGGLPTLNPGDIVEVDPATYNEVKRWTRSGTAGNPIIIRGVGSSRPIFDATGLRVDGALPNPRAVFQVEANFVALENLEFRNARNGDNGAGVRVTGGNNVAITGCKITLCDMGIMCDNNSNFLIEYSEIASNGTSLYDGYSHNLYLGGTNTTVRFSYIHDALFGQNFKTRGHYTELLYNYIADSQDGEIGLVDAATTNPTNSNAVLIGNVVISKPRVSGYNSGRFIQFGQDSGGQHNGTLFAFNNTFIAGDSRIQFLSANAAGANIIAANNIFYGSPKVLGTLGGGISGTNNWLPTGATLPVSFANSLSGTAPGFINAQSRNYRLTSASDCRDTGLDVLSFQDGAGSSHPGQPVFEYLNHLKSASRSKDAQLDIGAYEYAAPSLIHLRFLGKDCLVDFTTVPGVVYELQRTASLRQPAWAPAVTNIIGSGNPTQVTDVGAAGQFQLFYRVLTSL
jgi:hypothetical protein